MLYPNFSFTITHQDARTHARCTTINTPHGVVETPNFIFCATKATIKGVDLSAMPDTQIILANTYHLMLQPGAKTIKALGGLHKMMAWDKPLLSDSGGYQIFSLGHGSVANEIKGKRSNNKQSMLKITEEGAKFKSYIDGSYHLLTPEKSIDIQRDLGVDFMVVLDECTPFNVSKSYTQSSMNLSHRWARRSLSEFIKHNDYTQSLYGIVQGGVYEDLRKESANFINEQDFFAHAIGGSLGANKNQMYDIVAHTMGLLSKNRPVHLLGIGGVRDIFNGVKEGIDTFDCVHPTRLARHGGALVKAALATNNGEHINLLNSRYKNDSTPIDEHCTCNTCKRFSRGYLHHLFKAKEMLGMQLVTIHNVNFMNKLMYGIRNAIKNSRLVEEEKLWCDRA
jgi:queuine tRNA-ribosyltransferase